MWKLSWRLAREGFAGTMWAFIGGEVRVIRAKDWL